MKTVDHAPHNDYFGKERNESGDKEINYFFGGFFFIPSKNFLCSFCGFFFGLIRAFKNP